MKTLFPAHAQQGQKYATGGNNLSATDLLGSKNHAPLRFFTGNTERARFSAAGYSGTGTSNPQESLHVSGNIRTDGSRSIINGFNGGNNHWFKTNGPEPASLFMAFNGMADGQAQAVSIAPGGNTGAGLTVTASKNVGIGTAYPDEKLQVNGNVKITQDVHIAGNATICGELFTTRAVIETPTCDFVFDADYNRPAPEEKEALYKQQHHLRGIDPAAYIEANGFDLGKNLYGIIMNVEENGLDIIDLSKENKALKNQIAALEKKNQSLSIKYQILEERIKILENE